MISRPLSEFYAELETAGEQVIRERLVSGNFGRTGTKRDQVEEWLRQKDQSRTDSSNREQTTIARDAATAARDSADAARDAADEAKEANLLAKQANTIAKIAIAIAAIATIISIISVT